jgi:hypothetical protein
VRNIIRQKPGCVGRRTGRRGASAGNGWRKINVVRKVTDDEANRAERSRKIGDIPRDDAVDHL